jgi:hypothetical protein
VNSTIEGYRDGRLLHWQVGEVLGLDYWQTEAFLKERDVTLNYSAAGLADDHVTLAKILAPSVVREWAESLPQWVAVKTPKALHLSEDLDQGELEAICLAQEINASAVLIDDRVGRKAALRYGLEVIGTIGLLEEAAARELLERLRRTNACLDPKLIHEALERDKRRRIAPRRLSEG